jgi:hypothetical protein
MGLEAGVFGKGGAGLVGLGQAELARRNQSRGQRLEQFLKFLQLARIMRGQHQAIAFAEPGDAHRATPLLLVRAAARDD